MWVKIDASSILMKRVSQLRVDRAGVNLYAVIEQRSIGGNYAPQAQ